MYIKFHKYDNSLQDVERISLFQSRPEKNNPIRAQARLNKDGIR